MCVWKAEEVTEFMREVPSIAAGFGDNEIGPYRGIVVHFVARGIFIFKKTPDEHNQLRWETLRITLAGRLDSLRVVARRNIKVKVVIEYGRIKRPENELDLRRRIDRIDLIQTCLAPLIVDGS